MSIHTLAPYTSTGRLNEDIVSSAVVAYIRIHLSLCIFIATQELVWTNLIGHSTCVCVLLCVSLSLPVSVYFCGGNVRTGLRSKVPCTTLEE